MGLGKTLSVLSLICWSLDAFNDPETTRARQTSLTTLVVAPKSSMKLQNVLNKSLTFNSNHWMAESNREVSRLLSICN